MNWQEAVERTVMGLGYELVDTERSAGGLLRVFVDHPPSDDADATLERYITVDDCERVTRQLQHVLEVEGCAYSRLEVSSPGLDRPLKRASDYRRFVGQQVELTLKLPFQGRKKFRGELQTLGEGWRLVLAAAAPSAKREVRPVATPDADDAVAMQALDFSLDEVREARLVPVLDFKGRRFAPQGSNPAVAPGSNDEVDGGRIQ